MQQGWGFNRRALLRSWLVSLLGKKSAGEGVSAGDSARFDPVSLTLHGFAPAAQFQRRYRMDATILLLGAPIYTRQGAGGAYASVETGQDPAGTAVALQFAAGSFAARAHGLNRFGVLREAVIRRAARPDAFEFSFAGLMTRSREESFAEGREALASSGHGAEGVVARGRGSGTGGESKIQTWIDTIGLSPDSNWSNLSATLTEALREEPRTLARETDSGPGVTFLYAMRSAALCGESVVRREFLHAGRSYWLETRRPPQRPLELEGAIQDLSGHDLSAHDLSGHDRSGARRAEFRTAYAPGDESGIPIRIEYRPRSFLRLVFEAELEATQPPIPSMFPPAFPREGPQEGD